MKKILLLLITILLLTGCGKVDKDKLIKNFTDNVDTSKSYYVEAKMEIYNSEDTFSYNMKVYYMDDDYFKVDMVNAINNHQQIILRNSDAVYVVTPSLNKSYKFMSEWPYNSSQAYILNTLAKDILADEDVEFGEEDGKYFLKTDVNYPNNNYLKYEKLYFDKDMNLKTVLVYDVDDIVSIKVDFTKIDYKANLNDSEFDVDNVINVDCCKTDDSNKTEQTSALEDIIYPLYVPSNTYLKNKEMLNTENGERVILTFNGDKNFVLIEEVSNVKEEFEIVPIYGDPLKLSDTIGALSTNSLTWTSNNVDYYLASNDLSTEEILSIADSLNINNTTVYYEK